MTVPAALSASAAIIQAPAVTWQPVADAVSYQVQVRPHGARWEQGTTVDVPTNSWQPENLPFSGQADWRARGVTRQGPASWSPEQAIRLLPATPPAPTKLRASRKARMITLSWDTPQANKYGTKGSAVYWSRDGEHWRPVAEVKGTHAVLRVNPKAAYWFLVASKNAAGEGSPRRIRVK